MKLLNNTWVQGIIAIVSAALVFYLFYKINPFLDRIANKGLYVVGTFIGRYLIMPIFYYLVISFIVKALKRFIHKKKIVKQ